MTGVFMKYQKFGGLDEQISILGFGAASSEWRWWWLGFGHISDDDAVELVHAALECGITVYDTAPIYGFGESERRLGLALADRRDEAFLVSKCGIAYDDQKRVGIDNSPQTTRTMLEASLRRLGTDMIDLYLVHGADPKVDIRKTMEVLARARERGFIRYIGLSNTFKEDLDKAREITSIDAIQLEASFLNPRALDLIEQTQDLSNLGVMSWGTLAKGILTGRVSRDRTFRNPLIADIVRRGGSMNHEPSFEVMEALKPLLNEHETDGLGLALGYLVYRQSVDTLLCSSEEFETVGNGYFSNQQSSERCGGRTRHQDSRRCFCGV